MEPVVKPGWQTSAFWVTLGVGFISFLVLFGVIGQDDAGAAKDAIPKAVENAFALIAIATAAWKFIQGRSEVSKGKVQAAGMKDAAIIQGEAIKEAARISPEISLPQLQNKLSQLGISTPGFTTVS